MLPPLYKHQEFTADFIANNPRVLITSDPGTGKTRSVLEGFKRLRAAKGIRRMLVLAPLSILRAAWGDDILRWTPTLSWGISTAGSDKKRLSAFESDCDVVITNHDAVKWLDKNRHVLNEFDVICTDESTAFKNPTSQRSKAMARIADLFEHRITMSGTPNPRTVLDLWHQALITDDGERLGKLFWEFRSQVCTPIKVAAAANAVQWIDRPGATEIVADKLRDITVRFRLNDCIDMPENTIRSIYTDLPPKNMAQYKQLEKESVIMADSGDYINAVHAGARVQKLLQLCSGAIYDETGLSHQFQQERYQLVLDLVMERDHSVVAFLWRHQREALCKLADKAGIKYAVIDGSTPTDARTLAVQAFQRGELQTIFAHPQSAGHGLTLTKGCATIWASPTYNLEHYEQFNARINRAGQTRKTETIHIAARGTWEEKVYEKLEAKQVSMRDLLHIFAEGTQDAA
ncbi:ATP-dependent helicase [Motiliproteus coralliicola]|uniref:ATP-dependent helicase n=1 Tax=Motiliproteus coralliicola TaxID=2283196 RepID=A0A369X076_9GAMM|nr:DEAD/DEAH box helicase [Motiliproteus coralliicola]RDE25175.1 ATP-dependent helicase [Motiliproteus coralliicola]